MASGVFFPDEILLLIFSHISPYELRFVCPFVCQRWRKLSAIALSYEKNRFCTSLRKGTYSWALVEHSSDIHVKPSSRDTTPNPTLDHFNPHCHCSIPSPFITTNNIASTAKVKPNGTNLSVSSEALPSHHAAPVLLPRYKHATCYMDGWLYVFGGQPDPGSKLNDFWKLNIATRTWRRIVCPSGVSFSAPEERDQDHQPCPRSSATLVALARGINGKGPRLILFGGHALPSTLFELPRMLDTLHVFYPEDGPRWERLRNPLDKGGININKCYGSTSRPTANTYRATYTCPPPTAGHSAAVFELDIVETSEQLISGNGGKKRGHFMLVFGGLCSPGPYSSNTLWVFDLQSMTWSHASVYLDDISIPPGGFEPGPPSRFNHSHAPLTSTGDWLVVGGVSTTGLKYFDAWVLRTGGVIGENPAASSWWYWIEVRIRGASIVDNGTRILTSPLSGGWPPNLWARSSAYVPQAQALVVAAPESPHLGRERRSKTESGMQGDCPNSFLATHDSDSFGPNDTVVEPVTLDQIYGERYNNDIDCCSLCHSESAVELDRNNTDTIDEDRIREYASTSSMPFACREMVDHPSDSHPSPNLSDDLTWSPSKSDSSSMSFTTHNSSPFGVSDEGGDPYFYELQTETELWKNFFRNRKHFLVCRERDRDRRRTMKRLENLERIGNRVRDSVDFLPEPIYTNMSGHEIDENGMPISLDLRSHDDTSTLNSSLRLYRIPSPVSTDNSLSHDIGIMDEYDRTEGSPLLSSFTRCLICFRCRHCRRRESSHPGQAGDVRVPESGDKRAVRSEPSLQIYYLDLKPLLAYLKSTPYHDSGDGVWVRETTPHFGPDKSFTVFWKFSPYNSHSFGEPIKCTSLVRNARSKKGPQVTKFPPPETIFYSLNFCEGACLVMVGGARVCIPSMASHVPEITADKVTRDTYIIK